MVLDDTDGTVQQKIAKYASHNHGQVAHVSRSVNQIKGKLSLPQALSPENVIILLVLEFWVVYKLTSGRNIQTVHEAQ